LEPAGRVELDDQRLGALGLGAVDRDPDQTQGDRVDHALDLDRRHGLGRRRRHGRHEQRREYDQEPHSRRETLAALHHFCSARRLTSSKSRLAAMSAVICPGPSYGGETSTMSAPTSDWPTSARTSTSASYDVSPPTSGVPVPGANAGSSASMSNHQ